MTYLLTFFVVTNLTRTRRQLTMLLSGIIALATMVAVAMIAQFLVGDRVQLFPGRVETLSTQDVSYAGITRVLPPGQSLVLVGCTTLVFLLVLEKPRLRSVGRILQGALLGLALVLTFNRNFWVAVGIALLLLMLLARAHEQKRLAMWIGLTAIAAGIVWGLIGTAPGGQTKGLIDAAAVRVTTLFSADTLEEGSLQARYIENRYALRKIASQPYIGLGLGSFYRPRDPRLDFLQQDLRGYIHNGHLWLILKTGFLGYACFLTLSALYVWRGLRYWEVIAAADIRAIYLAFSLTYVGVFVAAVVNPVFRNWSWTPLLGIMMGANEAVLNISVPT
jgi:hypothetical protein